MYFTYDQIHAALATKRSRHPPVSASSGVRRPPRITVTIVFLLLPIAVCLTTCASGWLPHAAIHTPARSRQNHKPWYSVDHQCELANVGLCGAAMSVMVLSGGIGRRPWFILSNTGMLICSFMWTLTAPLFHTQGDCAAASGNLVTPYDGGLKLAMN